MSSTKGVKTTALPEVQELRLDDTVVVSALISGKMRTAQIRRRNLPNAGGDIVQLDPGQTQLDETEHLGKILDAQNTLGAVVLELPDHELFESYGLIARISIATGNFPVSVTALVPGQLRAPRSTGPAFTNNTVFLGTTTANAAEISASIIRDLEGWIVECAFGVRQAALDDTTQPVGSTATHAIEVRDASNVVVVSDLTRLDVNGAATVSTPGGGQVELTVIADTPTETTLTFGATIAWNVTTDPTTQLALTGNCEIDASGVQNGATYKITLTQDATGGRVVTWDANFIDKPEIEQAPNAVTILVFEAHAGGLYSPGNVGDPAKIGDLNELLVIDADSDKVLIERDSDDAVFYATPQGLARAIMAPVVQGTNARTLSDIDHNTPIELTISGTTVTATNLLTDGFIGFLINRSGASATIAGSGVTISGETSLGDGHFATLYKRGATVTCRVSG